jgi:hypothetical protein
MVNHPTRGNQDGKQPKLGPSRALCILVPIGLMFGHHSQVHRQMLHIIPQAETVVNISLITQNLGYLYLSKDKIALCSIILKDYLS